LGEFQGRAYQLTPAAEAAAGFDPTPQAEVTGTGTTPQVIETALLSPPGVVVLELTNPGTLPLNVKISVTKKE